jgi:hypothetical protein
VRSIFVIARNMTNQTMPVLEATVAADLPRRHETKDLRWAMPW